MKTALGATCTLSTVLQDGTSRHEVLDLLPTTYCITPTETLDAGITMYFTSFKAKSPFVLKVFVPFYPVLLNIFNDFP